MCCKKIKNDHPDITELLLGSDSASCLASYDNTPYVHELNQCLDDLFLYKRIYNDANTDKNRINTHFSCVNLKLHGYMLDGNDITTETEIFKALSYSGGMAGSTVTL